MNKFREEIEQLSKLSIDWEVVGKISGRIKKKMPMSNKGRNEILEKASLFLSESVKRNRRIVSFGVLRFIFFSGFNKPIDELRKKGVFRASKAKFDSQLIKDLVAEAIGYESLTSEDRSYLRSVLGLISLAPDVLYARNRILAKASEIKYFFKTLLAFGEAQFGSLLEADEIGHNETFVGALFRENKESLISAVSYVIQIYREVIGEIKLIDSNDIDEMHGDDFYFEIIGYAFSIQQYLEAEIKVDCFYYDVRIDFDRNSLLVFNESFETFRSHGYTKTLLRAQSRAYYSFSRSKAKGFMQLLEELWERDSRDGSSILYEIKSKPAERVVLSNVDGYFHVMEKLGAGRSYFKEEELQLEALCDENYNVNIHKIKICGDMTVLDLLKIQRFFRYVGFVYKKACDSHATFVNDKVDILRRRSILPVFDRDALIEIFNRATGKCVASCELLLDLLANASVESDEVVDLQYRPIIKIERRYLVLPTIFSCSNVVRSLAKIQNIHLSIFEDKDRMVDAVADALAKKNFVVHKNVKFGADEIDIVGEMDGYLFLFECKNPYHPVDDYELRNTYSHLLKGFSQVNKFRERFKDRKALIQFLKKIGINGHRIKNVGYGVINANRALSGMRRDGVLVLHANEMINFISTGMVSLSGRRFCTWNSTRFQADDLVAYIGGEVLSNDLILHKVRLPFSVRFGKWRLCLDTFQYDLTALQEFNQRMYREVIS